MTPVRYDEMRRARKDPKVFRYKLVSYAKEHGIKPAARAFDTTPKTVRKWLRRWEPGSMRGLSDRSRAPKHPKTYITNQQREKVIKLKELLSSFGAQRIKDNFNLSISEKSIRKIWRKEGLLKRKRKKHKTKQNLREVKAQWRLFEQTCIDTKDLDAIPERWTQIRALRLPRVQYTAREVTSWYAIYRLC